MESKTIKKKNNMCDGEEEGEWGVSSVAGYHTLELGIGRLPASNLLAEFDDQEAIDPFLERRDSLWLLHYELRGRELRCLGSRCGR